MYMPYIRNPPGIDFRWLSSRGIVGAAGLVTSAKISSPDFALVFSKGIVFVEGDALSEAAIRRGSN